jgi:glutamate racemase
MAKNNNPNSSDPYGFDRLTVPELNKVIADTVKQNLSLVDQKKEYVAATNEVLRENKKKIDAAIAARNTADVTAADDAHEQRVADYLNGAAQQAAV